MKAKRVSPMKGRKISKENRGPNAPKLGRKFEIADETEKVNLCFSLPKGTMEKLLKSTKLENKGGAVRIAIMSFLKK